MDNTHEPPIGDPQESWPTQEIDPSAGQPGPRLVGPDEDWSQSLPSRGSGGMGGPAGPVGPAGPGGRAAPGAAGAAGGPGGLSGPGGPFGPPPRPAKPRRHGTAAWWGAGLALVLVLAGGGAAAAELTSSSAPAPTALTGQAAQLNSLLNSSSSNGSGSTLSSTTSSSANAKPCLNRAKKLKAAGYPGAARALLRYCGHRLRRLRLLGGMHGEFTFETKTGPRTIAFERGVVESVSGSNVVVKAKDGTTWTWVLESSTVIRQGGKKTTSSAVSDGEQVFAGGSVISGGYDAKLIVVKPGSGGSSPSPTPSPATGS